MSSRNYIKKINYKVCQHWGGATLYLQPGKDQVDNGTQSQHHLGNLTMGTRWDKGSTATMETPHSLVLVTGFYHHQNNSSYHAEIH